MLEGFGLANAFERRPKTFIDEQVDSFDYGLVVLDPVLVVGPAVLCEGCPHSANGRSAAVPALCWAMLSSRCAALASVRNRYAVSSSASKSASDIRTALPFFEMISTGA